MERTTLDGHWTLEAVAGPPEADAHRDPVAAVVPGCVHTDLLRAGRIPDPFDGDGEAATQWIGDTVWRYRRTFEWAGPGDQATPTAPGAGASAIRSATTSSPTGSTPWPPSSSTASSSAPPRTSTVRTASPSGICCAPARTNWSSRSTLRFPLRSASRSCTAVNSPTSTTTRTTRSARTRRTSAGTGVSTWRTSGIWKSIGIESWSGVRIAAVRPLVDVDGTTGVLTAHVDVEFAGSSGAFAQAIGSAPVASTGGDAGAGLEARITLAPHHASAAHPGSDTAPPVPDDARTAGRIVGARPVATGPDRTTGSAVVRSRSPTSPSGGRGAAATIRSTTSASRSATTSGPVEWGSGRSPSTPRPTRVERRSSCA